MGKSNNPKVQVLDNMVGIVMHSTQVEKAFEYRISSKSCRNEILPQFYLSDNKKVKAKLANIRVKRIHGFAKGFDYRPGHQFHPGEDITHAWNAVFIFGAWRLIDVTWGTDLIVIRTKDLEVKLKTFSLETDREKKKK
ncbi:kyphoscoliosis peptidase [Trichonephila clavipes]|nr:kyphoscoliosis peptidase [Trichonephila clavipes]